MCDFSTDVSGPGKTRQEVGGRPDSTEKDQTQNRMILHWWSWISAQVCQKKSGLYSDKTFIIGINEWEDEEDLCIYVCVCVCVCSEYRRRINGRLQIVWKIIC